jgi:hypothetical protein
MNRTKITLIAGSFALSTAFVIILFLMSEDMIHKRNSFLRLFPSHSIMPKDTFDIQYDTWYIAGTTNNTIYLGNYTAPLYLLVIDRGFSETKQVRIDLEGINSYKFWSIRVKVDSPNFFMTDGTIPVIFKGTTSDWKATNFSYDSTYFLDMVPLSGNSLAVRSMNTNSNNMLGKITPDTRQTNFFHDILKKQVDGMFCTTGDMEYDNLTGKLVYVYNYRNQYIVMDSMMNVEYEGKTIDTISRAQIKVAKLSAHNKSVMAAPPLMVNKRARISEEWLFVQSNLLAKNENLDAFNSSSVIDVYSLKDKEYKYSFYIKDFNKTKMRDFCVIDKRIIILTGNYILSADLMPDYLE